MKILYFSFVELDIPNACQTHTLGILKGLSKNRCVINALVPRPLVIKPDIPDVRFHYLWPWRFSFYGRIWIKLLSFLMMICLCLKNKYDAIYVREMELNPGPRICSKIFKIPLYIEINDLIPVVMYEKKLSEKKILKVKQNQKKDMMQSKGIIVPSVPMCKWLSHEYGLPAKKIHMILNGTNHLKKEKFSRLQVRKKIGIPDKCLCLAFVGNLYEEYDFYTILRAVKKFATISNNIRLIIIGNGPLYNELRRNTNDLKISERVIFTGYIPQEKLGRILPAADVGLLIRTKKGASIYGPLSTKLSTYALFNLAVIVAGTSFDGYPNKLKTNLYIVPPGNSDALSDIFFYLCKNSDERKTKAKHLHKFAITNLTWISVTKKILDIMENNYY